MIARACIPAALLLAGLIGLIGCDKKKEDESDGGGGTSASTARGEPGASRFVPRLRPTEGWSRVELAAARTRSANNLHQIGIAFHMCQDSMQFLPTGYYDESGKKLGLSWRVALLPYIEHVDLYYQFKLNEPWDSEHNKKLIDKMPKTYAPPGTGTRRGYTYYRAFTGPNTAFPFNPRLGPPPSGPMPMPARGASFNHFTDGLSNTFLVAEAAEPVIWTKPEELEYDAKKPVPKLGGVFEGGFNVVFGDGSVRFLSMNLGEQNLRNLITINDGQVVNIP